MGDFLVSAVYDGILEAVVEMMDVAQRSIEPWRRRLFIPAYGIGEAARYAEISAQTVASWHSADQPREVLSRKEQRASLSYMQLIEVAVVAAFRKANIQLRRIRDAREYLKTTLTSEFPFAEYKFKTDGKHLLLEYNQIDRDRGRGKLLSADEGGQLAWNEIIGPRLKEFEYEHEGIVIKWHLRGVKSSILIDPRVSFGAPTVHGTPTWAVKGRWVAGESVEEIAEDFSLEKALVRDALLFEGYGRDELDRPASWAS
jgi:uncharacterized protein (DUF433 family)